MTEQEGRERRQVVAEARTWLGTPYHLNARIKGAGADCGTFLIAAFAGAGLIEAVDLGTMSRDFHLHRGDEVYLRWVARFCREVTREPRPGDILLYQYGRVMSHGALVVDFPRIIHATADTGVVLGSATEPALANRQAAIFSFWGGK